MWNLVFQEEIYVANSGKTKPQNRPKRLRFYRTIAKRRLAADDPWGRPPHAFLADVPK